MAVANDMKPLNLTLALSVIRQGMETIRQGRIEEGLRSIDFGVEHLEQFTDTPEIVQRALERAHAAMREQRTV